MSFVCPSREVLLQSCHSVIWAEHLLSCGNFASREEFWNEASRFWRGLSGDQWLEAFAAHPRIGDVESLKKKFITTKNLASEEQGLVKQANQKILEELRAYNEAYFNKFGFIFIVFATGKSAEEMLDLLKVRILNSKEDELKNAAEEQLKIAKLRLEKSL